jgi:hypothetical protein
MSDPGQQLLERVRAQLDLDDRSVHLEPRGFLWWGGGLAQRVWADPPRTAGDLLVARVSWRTDLLRRFRGRPDDLAELSVSLDDLALCAFIRGDAQRQQLQLGASLYVTRDELEWGSRVAGFAASLQAGIAHRIAAELAILVGAEPDLTTPPDGQIVASNEKLLALEETVVRPLGDDVSRWGSEELGRLRERVFERLLKLEPREQSGVLTAHLPFGEERDPALLIVESARAHPFLGAGVWSWLLLPPGACEEPSLDFCLAMNQAESVTFTAAHSLGTWCEHRNQLAYTVFLPNALYGPELLERVIVSQALRARWAEPFLESLIED